MLDLQVKLLDRVNALLDDIQAVLHHARSKTISQFEVHEMASRLSQLIHSIVGAKSSYAENLRNALKQKSTPSQFGAVAGVAVAFQRDLTDNNLVNIRHEVEAVVVTEILAQAKQLGRTKGIHSAAVVLVACAGLEEFLRNWCEEKGLSIPERNRSIARFAQELRSAGHIDLPTERRIGSWADYRNDAAHGSNWEVITQEIANRLLNEVEGFCLEYRHILG